MQDRIVYFDDRTPGNDNFSLYDGGLNDCPSIPLWLSWTYWVSVDDILAVGAVNIDFEYIDPTGQTRTVNGSPISLQDSTAQFSSPLVQAVRQSDSSLARMVMTLAGLAASSKVSCRVRFTGDTSESIGGYTAWT